ncbi:MAG: hypothetical protein BMS9Abin05_0549 [Rhodothermia bacterium]|nr:MAG: hypothetical protein BMS9Abin05_0549 [Rhodothermia bacterium]
MIIPSIDIQGGRAVQLRQGREFILDGGDPMDRLEEFSIAGEVAVIDLDAALGTGSNRELIQNMARAFPIRVGGGIRTREDAESWLNAGVKKVIIGTNASETFCSVLPKDRIIAAVDAVRGEVVVDGWQEQTGESVLDRIRRLAPFVGGFLLTQVEFEGGLSGYDRELIGSAQEAASGVRITAAGGIRSADDVADLDQLKVDAQVGMALYTGRLSLGETIAACLNRPVDGRFWPTVVCNEQGGTLGLVWSTAESVSAAVEQRRGIYWSRTRDKLWFKGATSGNTQQLLRVDLDCDRDALRYTVEQHGGFCHLGTKSCWSDSFDLSSLVTTLRARIAAQDPDSGTVRLANNLSLLREKLIEEAIELGEATERDEVIHEAADLLYFLSVAIANASVSFDDIINELELRNRRVVRRPMHSKGPASSEEVVSEYPLAQSDAASS